MSSEDFSVPRGSCEADAKTISRRAPGQLTKLCLEMIKEYLALRQEAGGKEVATPAIFRAYLASVLGPAMNGQMGPRNIQELSNLAGALDAIILGDVVKAMDILAGRFQCVETAMRTGDWALSGHLQVINDGRVTCVPDAALAGAAKAERYSKMLEWSTRSA